MGSKVLQSRLSLCVIATSIFEAVADRVLEATYVLKDSHLFPEIQDFLHWFKTIMAQWSDSVVTCCFERQTASAGSWEIWNSFSKSVLQFSPFHPIFHVLVQPSHINLYHMP